MSLLISLLIINVEIILGLFLLLNVCLKTTLKFTFLLTVFFTFLTAYAVFSGKIKSCGCFGDCIPLDANQSFGKDIVLLIVVSYLLFSFNKQKATIHPKSFLISSIAILLVILLEIWVLGDLPLQDCLPYKVNTNVAQKLKQKLGSGEKKEITYRYSKNNNIVEFSATNFPQDFDSTYIYIDRKDKIISTSKEQPMELDVFTYDFVNKTNQIVHSPTLVNLLCIKNIQDIQNDNIQKVIQEIQKKSFFENTLFYIISSQSIDSNSLKKLNIKSEQSLLCDKVTLKTIARSDMTLYQIQNGIIQNKQGYLTLKYFY